MVKASDISKDDTYFAVLKTGHFNKEVPVEVEVIKELSGVGVAVVRRAAVIPGAKVGDTRECPPPRGCLLGLRPPQRYR